MKPRKRAARLDGIIVEGKEYRVVYKNGMLHFRQKFARLGKAKLISLTEVFAMLERQRLLL